MDQISLFLSGRSHSSQQISFIPILKLLLHVLFEGGIANLSGNGGLLEIVLVKLGVYCAQFYTVVLILVLLLVLYILFKTKMLHLRVVDGW